MEHAQYFNTMKVSELKQIIKEEIKNMLNENSTLDLTSIESTLSDFYNSQLAKELRLSKEITSEERVQRLQSFAKLLKSYMDKVNNGIEEESFWISQKQ